MAFVHSGGTMARKELKAGEQLNVDTGCIIGFTSSINYDIEFIGGIRNSLFGGEGLFYATLTGPGVVHVQSLPFSRLASRIWQPAPQGGSKDKGEGGFLGGIGDMIGGNRGF